MDETKDNAQPMSNSSEPKNSKQEKTTKDIFNMGYPEADVRRALRASFGNPERAIEYLISGIPDSPSTPEGDTSETDSSEISPSEFFHTDPQFRQLRRNVMRNPEYMNATINRFGSMSPLTLRYVNEHREEFLKMLVEPFDDDNLVEDEDEGVEQDEGEGEGVER